MKECEERKVKAGCNVNEGRWRKDERREEGRWKMKKDIYIYIYIYIYVYIYIQN